MIKVFDNELNFLNKNIILVYESIVILENTRM